MGQCCTGSGPGRPLPAELQAATRKYFHLGELPVTLSASVKGQALFIRAAGLDHDNLLLALEAGFHERFYWIRDASIHINRGLFLGNFELMPRRSSDEEEAAISSDASPSSGSSTLDSAGKVTIVLLDDDMGVVPAKTLSPSKLANQAKIKGDAQEAAVRALGDLRASTIMASGKDLDKLQAVSKQARGSVLLAADEANIAPTSDKQLAKADAQASALGAVVRVMVVREWAPGVRKATEMAILDSGMRIVMARLSISRSTNKRSIKDTFWLAGEAEVQAVCQPESEGQERQVSDGDSPQRGRSRATMTHGNGEQPQQRANRRASTALRPAPRSSMTKVNTGASGRSPNWLNELQESISNAQPNPTALNLSNDQGGFAVVLSHRDGHDLSQFPEALQSKLVDLQYKVEQAPHWGLQFDGISKYSGCGMSVAHSGQHVLEFSTFYLKTPSQEGAEKSKGGLGTTFATLIGLRKQQAVAEFITEYHPDSQCLTIFKVFLNDVLPAGKRAGVRCTAEQLPTMKVPSDIHWNGLEALRKLRVIHICDVVNWNTYSLMSAIGKTLDNEMEQWLLKEEAKASGLTLQDLETTSTIDVFSKTALGKMTVGVLKIWKQEYSVDHRIVDVSIEYDQGEQEMIFGEYRSIMDIYIQLEAPVTATTTPELAPDQV